MPDFADSPFIFTAPVRKYKANDPYYWEVDNIPIKQLEENCLWLKDQVSNVTSESASANVKRSSITELRPTVAGSTVSVEPGRYSARINDAFTLEESLSEPDFAADPNYLGQGSNWFTKNQSSVEAAINKIFSTSESLRLNGLIERFSQYAIYDVALGSQVFTGGDVTSTVIGDGFSWTGFPLVDKPKFYNILSNVFLNSLNNISYTQSIAMEFTKRWRGVIRTAIVDVPDTLTIDIPEFSPNDFFYIDEAGDSHIISANQRIDLVFLYSKPVDQGSTSIIKQGTVQQITQPQLGVVVGAGLGLDKSNLGSGEYAKVIKNPAGTNSSEADAFMLASKADHTVANGGFVLSNGSKVYGSFPSPDDLLNLAPLLANEISGNDWRTVGQSVLPIAYIVVDSTQAGTIPTANLIDIRPFFRTTELTYDERAGIAGAAPNLSLANPAVGKRELETHVNTIVTNALGTGGGGGGGGSTPPLVPRVVGGGYIWGGKKWGPEGAITAGLGDGGDWVSNGINGISYGSIPENPDWDWATWTNYIDPATGQSSQGTKKNDWLNFKYTVNRNLTTGVGGTLDFEEAGASTDVDIGGTENIFGNTVGRNSVDELAVAPLMMYWVKKRFHFSLPDGFNNYCVKAYFSNCVPLSDSGQVTVNSSYQSGGTEGIWITKGSGWFEINVGWVGPDPYTQNSEKWSSWDTDSAGAAAFPSSDRDTNKFRSWAVLHPELETTTIKAGQASETAAGGNTNGNIPNPSDINKGINVDKVGVCTYPTVLFEVVGFPAGWENNGFQLYTDNMPHNGTTSLTLR